MALVTLSLAACGGPSDTERIRSLVTDYVKAFSAGDGPKVCSLLTPAAQREIQQAAGLLRGKDCAATITSVAKMSVAADANAVQKFHAGNVVVDGNEAGVVIEPASPGTKPTRLVKVDGKWLFDGSVATTR